MTITDPKTGEIVFQSNDAIPEDKIPGIIQQVQQAKAREKTITGYTPMSQGSARMAENRVNMRDKLMEELAYNPITDQSKNWGQKYKALMLKPNAIALKGMGALGQAEEGALSSYIVAAQRGQKPWEGSYWDTVGRSVSGEAPTEFGDISRNVGLPETVSKVAGIGMSAFTPGYGEYVSGVNKLVGPMLKSTAAGASKLSKGITKAHLVLLAREFPEAADHAISNKFSMIKPGQKVPEIEDELTTAVAKAEHSASRVQKAGSNLFEAGLNRARNNVIDLKKDFDVVKVALTKGMNQAGMTIVEKGKKKLPTLVGDPTIPGSDTLAKVLFSIATTKKHSVGFLRTKLTALDGLIKKSSDNAAVKEIRAISSFLAANIRKQINTQSDVMKYINTRYKDITQYLSPDESAKLPGIFDLLKAKRQGGTVMGNYFALPREAKVVLEKFDAKLPPHLKFLKQLKDASTNNAFKELKPKAGFSLIGPAAAAVSAVTRPGFVPILGAATAAASPRLSAVMHKNIGETTARAGVLASKFKATPIGQAVQMLTQRGIIAPALSRFSTREAFGGGQQEE